MEYSSNPATGKAFKRIQCIPDLAPVTAYLLAGNGDAVLDPPEWIVC